MIPRGKSVILAGFVSFQWTDARRPTWPAFLVQAPPRQAGGDVPAHACRTQRREHRTPLFSATKEDDATRQLSDLDTRVIDELLSDPAFLDSLLEQGVQVEEREEDGPPGCVGNSTVPSSSSNQSGLAVAGKVKPAPQLSSEYESATMQVVEGLQDSVKGILAKVSAAFESAGIYVANRAQMDTKVIQAVVDYASKQAAAGTGRLLLAASDAASPALLMIGVNTTETTAALNDSVQLLSMGIVPDSVGLSPKLLPSFKDFDDDDKRLDAAYRRQRRRRSKPLPARLLGSLPSTINKAADLAYEVEQEVKYERAGSRSNKLLRPIGISLPEAKDNSLLLGRRPSGTGSNLLEAGDATSASLLPAQISGSKTVKNPLEDEQSTVAQAKGKPSRASTEREEPTPPSPDAFGVFRRFRRNDASTEGNSSTSSAGFAESIVDPSVAAMLTSRLDVLSGELLNCIGAVDDEVRLQERGVKAANAVLCSTEPVIAGLEKYLEKESALLDELKNVARSVQQMYVLAEMTEAVEAAETCLGRLEELLAHVLDLALELKRFVAAADIRMGLLAIIRSRLEEADGEIQGGMGREKLEVASSSLELLQSFDDEISTRQQEAKAVGRSLAVVWRESDERARDEAGLAHEDALVTACRLWKASAVESMDQRARAVERVRLELRRAKEVKSFTPSVAGAEEDRPAEVAVEARQESSSGVVSGAQVVVDEAKNGRVRAVPDATADDKGRNSQQSSVVSSVAQVDEVASVDNGVQVEDAEPVVKGNDLKSAATDSIPVVTAGTKTAQDVGTETNAAINRTFSSVDALDATVVSDSTGRDGTQLGDGDSSSRTRGVVTENPERKASPDTSSSNIEVVVDESSSSYVDVEVEVEDDVSDPTRVGLKVLDVSALLIEKVLFVGLPSLVSGGSLVWERVDNAMNGAKGRKGWRLLKRLKKDESLW